mmetsp:Transcript_21755/g.33250  ORF Transcript_21755/g.33250 Transcript_21755/m.33250 type:complete len:1380 (+) Transcript_21755:266-4405(+)
MSFFSKKRDNEGKAKDLRKNVELTAHQEELSDLLSRLGANAVRGLSSSDAAHKFRIEGPNVLTPPKTTPAWVKFLQELTGFFSLLLWGGAVLCFIGYGIDSSPDHLYLGIVLVFVVVVTGVFSFMQNSKSENLMNSFKNMLPPKVKIIRDGKNDEIMALNLVPGDIVFLEGGDLVPADLRVLECSDNFQVDNAALTGESEPQKRKNVTTHEDPLETQNLCFFGTQVPEGSCKGIVISTGDNTVMGRIAALAMSTSNEQTPINREIHHFIYIISGIAIFLGVLFFILNIIIGTPYIENLVFMIGIIVANVPEGLLATVTVCLTLTAQRMHAKKVLVKNLEGVETLGSTSCICSDKTGTLTQNVMTVAQVVYGDADTSVTKDAPSSFTGGRKTYDVNNVCFQKLCRCASLCNVATFNESSKWELNEEDGTKTLDEGGNPIPVPFSGFITQGDGSKLETIFWQPVGNASECAMIKLVQTESAAIGDVEATRTANPVKFVIPFNSKNKYQVHIHAKADGSGDVLQMKGAPERIIARCTHMMLDDKVVELTDIERKNIEEQQEALSANGLRCLGFAELDLDPNVYGEGYKYATDDAEFSSSNFPLGDTPNPDDLDAQGRRQNPVSTQGLVFLGLMALIDPPRPAVPPAVEKCKTAGVKVIMVTGDHPVTAQAIAYKVGILWSKTRGDMEKDNAKYGRAPGDPDYENPDDAAAIVVPGHTISVDTSEEEWDFILGHPQIVFARTSPQQKLVIVENNQRQGHIVAVTGDGVNDSPAIKKADIGIAMGIMGSEVSKNAADMILLDDNFASIVKGVEEGRLIFDNLKKSIAYTIQSNIPEITPFLGFIIFAIPLPLTTFLILAIDLGTDMIPAISMAYELPEADIMTRPPRNSKTDRLVTKRMINFSYLQIGLIQAIAGFFTYLVVFNDYGYSPSVLMGRGNTEVWGMQPFFCKFQGGSYVNLAGDLDTTRDPTIDPPSVQFPFWFPGQSGYLIDCGFAHNNYKGGGSNVSLSADGKSFNQFDSSTYGGSTKGHKANTIEAYEANYKARYFQYIPWRSRVSPFWQNRFLWWDVANDQNAGLNYGGADNNLYFGGRPAGLWSICAGNDGTLGKEGSSSEVRGAYVSPDAEVVDPSTFDFSQCSDTSYSNSYYKNAKFCNGQSTEEGTACDVVNSGKDGLSLNPFQSFYCKDSCGEQIPDSSLQFCDVNGNKCGIPGVNTPVAGCDQLCDDVCYSPSFMGDAEYGGSTSTGYKQCQNIASAEGALEVLRHAQGAFFLSIVVGQIAGLLVCKTRWLSVRTQGMRNNVMLFGIGTEILLCGWLAYCIPINDGLGTRNVRLVHWFCAIPFAMFIFIYDESRKAVMRATSPEKTDPITGQVTRKAGWLEQNTYY